MSKRLDLGLSGERVARGQRRPTEPFSVLSPLSPDDKFSRRLSNPDLRCKNKQVFVLYKSARMIKRRVGYICTYVGVGSMATLSTRATAPSVSRS